MKTERLMVELKARQRLLVMALVAIVLLAGASYAVTRSASTSFTIIDFDSDRCFDDIKALVANGPRMAGTNEDRMAAEYIKGEMKAAGLSNVNIETFTEPLFEVDRAEVSLVKYRPLVPVPDPSVSPVVLEHTIDFVLQGYSGSGDGDFEVFFAQGGWNESDFDGCQGMAALVAQGEKTPYNGNLHKWAHDAGAEALIVQNCLYDEEIGYPPIFKGSSRPNGWPDPEYPDIPFFMVSKEIGDVILESAAEWRVSFDIRVIIEERPVRVVIGEVPGYSDSGDFVILGAHHDTVYNAQGAVDNTVGTATVVELGRQLVKYRPEHTIKLATWSGEEEGLFGSINWVNAHIDEVTEHCIMYLNFDMNNVDLTRGNGQPIAVSCNATLERLEELGERLKRSEPELQKYNYSFYYSDLRGSSDQAPFAQNNVTVASAWGSGALEYHTYMDTLDKVNPESQQLAGRVLGSYALWLAS